MTRTIDAGASEPAGDADLPRGLLRTLVDTAAVGIGFLDADLRYVIVNEVLAEINGIPAADHLGRNIFELLPGLNDHLDPVLHEVLESGEPMTDLEVMGRTPGTSGTERRWLASYVPVVDPRDDSVSGIAVSVIDVTDRWSLSREVAELRGLQAADRFRHALDTLLEAIMIAEAVRDADGRIVDFRIVWVNSAGTDAHGRVADDIVGQTFLDLWNSPDGLTALELFARACDDGKPLNDPSFRYRHLDEDGSEVATIFSLSVAPLNDGVIVSWRDVTDSEVNRQRLARSEAGLSEAQRIGSIGSWRLDLAADHAQLSDQMKEMVGHASSSRDDLMKSVHPDDRNRLFDEAMAQLVIGDRVIAEHRLQHPVRGSREVRSVIEVERDDTGQVTHVSGVCQDITDIRLTQRRLNHVSSELAEEHRALVALQEALLPAKLPEVPGHRIQARYLSSEDRVDVGGDWYDVVDPGDGKSIALVVGDVAGHGIPAVGTMAEIRHALRAYLFEGENPAGALNRATRLLAGDASKLATCVVAALEPRTGRITWSSAGHVPPLVAGRKGVGRVGDGSAVGPPLGAIRDVRHHNAEFILEEGDSVLLHTDGLVERRSETIDEGLDDVARSWAQRHTSSQPISLLLRDRFEGGTVQDDVCVLACRRLGGDVIPDDQAPT